LKIYNNINYIFYLVLVILLFLFLFNLAFYFVFYFVIYLCSGSSSNLSLDGLGKVRAHEALEIEVGENIRLLELEKRCKLGIRVDLATILLVLKVVGADVCINVTSD